MRGSKFRGVNRSRAALTVLAVATGLGVADVAVRYWTEVTKALSSVNAMAVTQKVTAREGVYW